MMFFVRFWGVRGSIPCPGSSTIEFGGNTACIEIRAGNRIVVIDFGSGISNFSDYLLSHDLKNGPLDIDCFLSHTHLDHIFGLPMFIPFMLEKTKSRIYGPLLPGGKKLETVLDNIISYEYWPVRLGELASDITIKQIGETTLDLGGGLTVTSKYLNHPVVTLGYRFEYKGKSIVTAYDNEPFWNLFAPAGSNDDFYRQDAQLAGEHAVIEENEKLLDFYKNADILIFDCQYSKTEYLNGKMNWGHSSYEHAVEAACEANVKKLLLFHHDPKRNDRALCKIEDNCKGYVNSAKKLEIIMAREELVVEA
jgi:phosphoribosyl 1,2-cyclic phosphodiesterase